MESFLNVLRFFGLLVFGIGICLSLLTLINFVFNLIDVLWLHINFIRLYLFLAVSSILLYILITFRRKDDEKKE